MAKPKIEPCPGDHHFVCEWQIPTTTRTTRVTIFQRRMKSLKSHVYEHRKDLVREAKEISADIVVSKVLEGLLKAFIGH